MGEKKRKIFETGVAKSWIDADGIAHIYFKANEDISPRDVDEYLKNAAKISEGKSYPVLMDTRDVGFIYEMSLNTMISKEAIKVTKASAILLSNPPMRVRVFINFFLLLQKKPFPIKAFTDEKKAIAWLKTFNEPEKKLLQQLKL